MQNVSIKEDLNRLNELLNKYKDYIIIRHDGFDKDKQDYYVQISCIENSFPNHNNIFVDCKMTGKFYRDMRNPNEYYNKGNE